MELTYDWRCFQALFDPRRRAPVANGDEPASPVHLVVEDNVIVSVQAEGEDFSDWIGATYQDMASEVTHRELILFDRQNVDRWISEALALPHYYDQLEHLRAKAMPQVVSRSRFKRGPKSLVLKQGQQTAFNRHFVLEAIAGRNGWWAKVLPSSYGIFIRLEGRATENGVPSVPVQDLLVVVRRGRIDSFCEPELTAIGKERAARPADVVKYLSEKHLVPVQGFFVPARLWHDWAGSEHPWKDVAMAIRSEEAKMVPFRYSVATLIATRGLLGL